MILKGSQRAGALKLAAHLLRGDENDHVEVHELRGFSSSDLKEALREAEAIAKGTRCKQHLFSLSLNPPETEHVTVPEFEAAIDTVERKLGLEGQARAIVFHEKEGRRHAHVVWSRIDVEKMTAINLPFFKTKLNNMAKALFLEHGWRLPEGFRDRTNRNPLNFSLAEWQQAKRTKQDAQALKITLQECWSVSDSRAAFERALGEKGFLLAKGDRRSFVAIDWRGEVYSLTRWTGEKTKAVKARLGDPEDLRSADEVRDEIARRMSDKLKDFIREAEAQRGEMTKEFLRRKQELKARQQAERSDLRERQERRAADEARERASRFRQGLRGLWDWVSGRTRRIRKENEDAAHDAMLRDGGEREAQIERQLTERRGLQHELRDIRHAIRRDERELREEIAFYMGLRDRPEVGNIAKDQARGKSPELNR